MNIGFISTWFERGAAYVTKAYIGALKDNNKVFVYARGGENIGKGDPKWDLPYVTWGLRLGGTNINYNHFKQWIEKNKIDILFFNEQRETEILAHIKKDYPSIKIGSYIDYYKENIISDFWMFDFLICNTKRHFSVFQDHPQCFYVPWGTDVELFKPINSKKETLTFFHSVGMSTRKGTDLLVEAFLEGELYNKSKLIVHCQLDFNKSFGYSIDEMKEYNIEVIQKTISAPGLYHLGDVYVYPTTLDGLGLTLYEALSCGLPTITTNNGPMNEVVNDDIGYLVDVESFYSRSDGYYWPLSICNKESLIAGMNYYINNKNNIIDFKNRVRNYAIEHFNWMDRYKIINEIFTDSIVLSENIDLEKFIIQKRKEKVIEFRNILLNRFPDKVLHFLNKYNK